MVILSTLQWFMAIRVNAHCLLKQSERLWERRGHHPRIAVQLAQHCGFASHRHIHALHQLNGTFVACIHATAKQLQLTEGLERQLQALGHRFGQRLRRVIQPQCDLDERKSKGRNQQQHPSIWQAADAAKSCYVNRTSRTAVGLSWLKPSAALLLGAALMGAGFPEPDAKQMMGTWVAHR